MKKISIILIIALFALDSCTKSKEIHPEIGNGNDEIVTVGMDNVHIKYIRNDIASLQKVLFHYSLVDAQQFDAAEMTKQSDCFTLILNNLLSDTLYRYYYEMFPYSGDAYQTEQKTFHTQASAPTPPPVIIPEGAINGLFTINANGDQVYFSQGNLQYQASTNTWRFAEHQWDFVGGAEGGYNYGTVYENGVICDNALISSTYNGWIDLFGWGTSGYNHGAVCYQPWSSDDYPYTNYNVYGDYIYNLYDQTGKADWGFNAISNGGMAENSWRTLKPDEWDHILNTRITTSSIRYVKAYINIPYSVNGLVILPDDWDESYYTLVSPNTSNADYTTNCISQTDWTNIFEAHGAVFLPAAGLRFHIDIHNMLWRAGYWSSSRVEYEDVGFHTWAHALSFVTEDVFATDGYERGLGLSVRLVQDANK